MPQKPKSNNKTNKPESTFILIKQEIFKLVDEKILKDMEDNAIAIIDAAKDLDFNSRSKLMQLYRRRILSNYSVLPPNDDSIWILRNEIKMRLERKAKFLEERKKIDGPQ